MLIASQTRDASSAALTTTRGRTHARVFMFYLKPDPRLPKLDR